MVVRPTEPCPPEKLNRASLWLVIVTHLVSSRARPVAPCDPASGSRTGGALLRRLGAGRDGSAGLVLAYEAFQACYHHVVV